MILSRVQHHCFLHTLNLKKGSPRLYSLLTLLTALQKRNRLLKLFFYPKHPNHRAICYSLGTSFLRNINTTFPTGRKECSSPPKRNLPLSHSPRQAEKQNTIGAWSAQTQPGGEQRGRGTSFRGHGPAVPTSEGTQRLGAPRGRCCICSLDETYLMGVGSFSGST